MLQFSPGARVAQWAKPWASAPMAWVRTWLSARGFLYATPQRGDFTCLTIRLSCALKSTSWEYDMHRAYWHWHYCIPVPGARDHSSYKRHETHTLGYAPVSKLLPQHCYWNLKRGFLGFFFISKWKWIFLNRFLYKGEHSILVEFHTPVDAGITELADYGKVDWSIKIFFVFFTFLGSILSENWKNRIFTLL